MKCGNCGSEWNVDASKSSSFTVCPVCQEKLTNEKKSGWQFFDNTEELLAFIAAEYGNDALFQRKHFSDHSSPTLTEGQKNLIKYAYQSGAVKILEDNMTSDQARQETAVKQAVGKIVDKHHTAEEVAKRVVWELTNALGWGMAKPQGSTAQKPPDSTPTKTTTTATTPASTSDSETDKLMTRAWLFAEDGDWDDATTYFNRVLDTEPTYAM
ncbi:MAG: hypothetical protein LBC96_05750, partial [Lachnospiraceae bacterium]|nr:hypothetical protein [Lachnospiraceae bacterium]